MLKHLLLMRHAKSSWSNPGLRDHERPLNGRGRRSADIIGQTLSAKGYAPDLIWASDSARTTETAKRLIRVIPGSQTIRYFPGFYHAGPSQVLQIADGEGEPEVSSLMWLGHNPGWGDLFYRFSGQDHPFPTAACAILERKSEGHWLSPDVWNFKTLLLPRNLLGE